jgi:hypothetical protein
MQFYELDISLLKYLLNVVNVKKIKINTKRESQAKYLISV